MLAKQDLPHLCHQCKKQIKKGQEYVYRESRKYENGFAYFHKGCKSVKNNKTK